MSNPQTNFRLRASDFGFILIFVYLWICLFVDLKGVHAVNMDSTLYRIQFGTIDAGGAKMHNAVDNTYYLTSSMGQAAAKEFQSNGYTIKAGFQYVYARIPFTFSLSSIHIDFGTPLPNTPVTAPLTLKVSFGGAGQYLVTARADSPLTRQTGTDTIPFTLCDGGINTCTISSAKQWTLTSAYGFGYGMTGQDIPADFTNSTYYRPFPSLLASEAPAIVMQSTNVTDTINPTPNPSYTPAPVLTGVPHDTTHQSTMTMKLNVSSIQPAGSYITVVRFLATPSF